MTIPPLALQLVAITHAAVIDMTGAAPHRDFTVLLRGDRIAAVGPSASTGVPTGTRIIEGRGAFIIPGLWDMHVHTDVPNGPQFLGLYVAMGVTGVRDMGGSWDRIQGYRRAIAAGTLVGPRIVAAGPYLDANDQPIAHIRVRTPDEARRAVDSLQTLGVDFIKIHSGLTRDVFFAAAREARLRQMVFAGHVTNVTVEEASDSGQKSLEHLLRFSSTCTAAESTAFAAAHRLLVTVMGRCVTHDQRALFARLVRNGTWVTPTLVPQWEFAILPSTALAADSLGHYIPDSLRGFWRDALGLPTNLPPAAESLGRAMFAKRLELVGEMHRARVPLLAGTDAPLRNSTPGFGLHEELAYFVRAGVSPYDALRAATFEPARYLDALDSLGTIERGKVADLVVLDADPLAKIGNSRRIRLVIARGRVIDSAARQALFRAAEQAARGGR